MCRVKTHTALHQLKRYCNLLCPLFQAGTEMAHFKAVTRVPALTPSLLQTRREGMANRAYMEDRQRRTMLTVPRTPPTYLLSPTGEVYITPRLPPDQPRIFLLSHNSLFLFPLEILAQLTLTPTVDRFLTISLIIL